MIQEGTILKLANLTQGHVAAVLAAALLLPGCDGGSEGTGEADAGTDTSAETTDAATGSGSGSDTDVTDGSGSTTDDPTGEDETGTEPPPEGLGCGEPPPCDKGEYVGSIRIESADQIEEIAGYTSITGWLEVFQSDLTCLDFLACMETVGHDVTIFGNEYLTDVTGTDAITALGTATADLPELDKDGNLVISENDLLVDLNGFNALEQVQGSLLISQNPEMTGISGFDTLVGARKNFSITFNPNLIDIANNGLKSILFIGGECVVTNNPSLCISTIEQMCGDLKQGPSGGSTANNDNSC